MLTEFKFDEMLAAAASKPIETLRACKVAHKGVRERQYQVIAVAVAIARHLKEAPKDYERFCRLSFWENHNTLNSNYMLSHVLMFVYGSHREPEAGRARRHAIALRDFSKGNEPASEVPHYIKKKGGIEVLYKMATSDEEDDDNNESENNNDEDNDNEDEEDGGIDQNEDDDSGVENEENDDKQFCPKPKAKVSNNGPAKKSKKTRSANLEKLKKLADEEDFLVVHLSDRSLLDDLKNFKPGLKSLLVQIGTPPRKDEHIPVEAVSWKMSPAVKI